ncbi:ATP-binding protein [Streptantibioticus ferralitis]|uniref:AAA family ATPase n=1 Tax=Streptantibioticus ferralitis TaxID=236510 RepID=A0ABT5Z6E0_9ACTN|nr:LuxR family transcriptional regulator [Streptantibioticus ferralitis]MDF2259402.1 AAA family ATPase [Streptantibioticus ferralitis]
MPGTLYGREREQAALDRLLGAARDGTSGVLALRGEPGIGKTALLDHAMATAAAQGMRVIRAAGVEYEAELPYAALHLLLAAGLDRLPALPQPQRQALECAFGLAAPATTDRLLTGLAVLSLLCELAEERPLLCVVDDAQWLDHASADALLLAARRLQAEPVALILAAREGEGGFTAYGLPELRLTGLAEEASAKLLDGYAGELAAPVRHRVLTEARGNPLALTELPAALAAEPVGAPDVPGAIPLTDRLQVAFHGQVSRLPAATQTLLLVAAAEQTGDLDVLRRAAETLGAGLPDLRPAEDAGLVRTALTQDAAPRSLTFRHPLLRAAVYRRAPLDQRLAVHRALADALAGAMDDEAADRRAWHLALAAPAPDEAIAAALEQAAVRAHGRGGHAAAAAAIERAARLTPDPDTATRRLTLSAEAAIEAAELARAEALAERAAARLTEPLHDVAVLPGEPRLRDVLGHVRATARFLQGDFPAAYRLLVDGADQAAGRDPRQAARMLMQAFHVAWYLGDRELGEVVDRLQRLEHPADDPVTPLVGYLVAATAPVLGRRAEPLPPLAETVAAAQANSARVPWDVVQVCGASLIHGRDAETYRLAASLAADSRSRGGFGQLPTVLFFLAEAELFHGRHRDALASATEALRIARDTGQRQWTSQLTGFLAYFAAIEGDADTCRRFGDDSLTDTGAAPGAQVFMAPGAPWTHWAFGLLDLGAGRAQEALNRLEPLVGGPMRHHVSATRAVPDLVEAAVRLGRPERARQPAERFARWTALTGQPWAEALDLRCRALLADDAADQEAWYTAALAAHEDPGGPARPLEQARTALLYGEWLRRGRRKAEARPWLRTAVETFERLGAEPWADRARTELGATGESAPRTRGPGVLAALTPQELQIVRLAARGLSNRDIAAQLFLSPRTVGYHLYKAYPKLGVSSRGELSALED